MNNEKNKKEDRRKCSRCWYFKGGICVKGDLVIEDPETVFCREFR